jgi:hypothetical protein
MEIKKRTKCAICLTEIFPVFDLGKMPLANHLLTFYDLKKPEKKYSLTLCFCENCGLLQLGQIVSPEVMYFDYLYVPSMSKTLVSHFEELSDSVANFVKKKCFVVDIGSNDGTLLKFFKKQGNLVLGIDPAKEIARVATQSGIETLPLIFNAAKAKQIVQGHRRCDVVCATNVFAHIENLIDLYRGVDVLLNDSGIVVVEVSYSLEMIKNGLFDAIYHEHLYYFSVTSLLSLFEKTTFEIFKIEEISMHGGSLRIWLKKKINKKIKVETKTIQLLLSKEKAVGLSKLETYVAFKKKVNILKKSLIKKLKLLKKQGRVIACFGAPAKGNILLNYFGIDRKLIDYVVDSTSYKQFRYTPGVHLQILPEETIYIEKPDYLLILAWNFASEIVKKHSSFKNRFLIPLPKLKIV